MGEHVSEVVAAPDRRPRVALPVLAGGLVLAYAPVVLPGLLRRLGLVELPWGPANALVWNWLAVGALVAYVVRIERLPLASLRLVRPTAKDIEWGCYLGAAGALWHWGAASALARFGATGAGTRAADGTGQLVALGPAILAAILVTAVVTEEILWRGYVVERLAAWIPAWVAAGLGLAVFAAAHVPFFGATWLVTVFPGAALLYVVLLWRRNLWACMACHLVGNLPLLVVTLIPGLG